MIRIVMIACLLVAGCCPCQNNQTPRPEPTKPVSKFEKKQRVKLLNNEQGVIDSDPSLLSGDFYYSVRYFDKQGILRRDRFGEYELDYWKVE
jgi:hypothetical protein